MSARLTFIGLMNFSDDRGVHPAKPKTLKAELYPMDDTSAADIAGWVGELVRVGLVAEFTSDGVDYWHITGWARHQKIDRPSFRHPEPPDPNSTSPRLLIVEQSTNAQRAPPDRISQANPTPHDLALYRLAYGTEPEQAQKGTPDPSPT